MTRRSYVGRHRRPVPPGRTRAQLLVASSALTGVWALADAGTADAATPPGGWGPYVRCESGGDPRASNGSHFGLFQFDLRTWRSVGGSGNPMDASVSEQTARAGMLYASRGSQPWDASASCRARHAGAAVPVVSRAAPRAAAPQRAAQRVARSPAAPPAAVSRVAVAAARTSVRRAPLPRTHTRTVVVTRGMTVSGIAAAAHVPMSRVTGFRSGNRDLIYVGERLSVR